MNKYQIHFKAWLMALMVVIIGGCGGSGSQSGGTLGVSLTDAPATGYKAVYVTVSKVRVHESASATDTDSGWFDITLTPAKKINLLNLTNGALEELGQTPLPAGHYTQLRLVLIPNAGTPFANSVVLPGTTTEIALDTPSGIQSGIKLVNQFDVVSGQRVDLVLDFDASKSVVKAGPNYRLKPVIRVVPTVMNGITGFVNISSLGSNVRISAQQDGSVIGSTVPTSTGEFFIARLTPGLYDVVLAADDHSTNVIAAVPVISTTLVTVVSIQPVPIRLQVSTTLPTTRDIGGTAMLNPTASTGEAPYLAASQTLGQPSLTVTVQSQYADLVSGAYRLALPFDAPLLGRYGALPIIFTAQPEVAGVYKIEASFTGYQSRSYAKDISAANALQDFILVP